MDSFELIEIGGYFYWTKPIKEGFTVVSPKFETEKEAIKWGKENAANLHK